MQHSSTHLSIHSSIHPNIHPSSVYLLTDALVASQVEDATRYALVARNPIERFTYKQKFAFFSISFNDIKGSLYFQNCFFKKIDFFRFFSIFFDLKKSFFFRFFFRLNMRFLNGWQPARFELRTCVLLMAGNQHVSNCEHAFS